MLEIIVVVVCLALAFSACVLLVMNQFKDEEPTWSSYLSDGVKFWKQIKK